MEETLTNPKLMIIGYAGWGKDTVGEMLAEHGFRWLASSAFATSKIMMPYFESIGRPYLSETECFNDRVSQRAIWFEQIQNYNLPDWNRVSLDMFEDGYDVYVGMRSEKEFAASKKLYDLVIWVDASKRLPPEDISSCTLKPEDADVILDNNGTLDDLRTNLEALLLTKIEPLRYIGKEGLDYFKSTILEKIPDAKFAINHYDGEIRFGVLSPSKAMPAYPEGQTYYTQAKFQGDTPADNLWMVKECTKLLIDMFEKGFRFVVGREATLKSE